MKTIIGNIQINNTLTTFPTILIYTYSQLFYLLSGSILVIIYGGTSTWSTAVTWQLLIKSTLGNSLSKYSMPRFRILPCPIFSPYPVYMLAKVSNDSLPYKWPKGTSQGEPPAHIDGCLCLKEGRYQYYGYVRCVCYCGV